MFVSSRLVSLEICRHETNHRRSDTLFIKSYYRRWWRRRQITKERERERENIDSWRFSRIKFNDASLFFVLCTFMYIICCDFDESLMSLSCRVLKQLLNRVHRGSLYFESVCKMHVESVSQFKSGYSSISFWILYYHYLKFYAIYDKCILTVKSLINSFTTADLGYIVIIYIFKFQNF